MSWIDLVVEQHKEFESPLSFWKWSALAAISAVVKDNVWLVKGKLYNCYPNIYVMLYADSGLKKGPPVAMAARLVNLVGGTDVIKGRSSIQGILKKLGEGGQSYTQPGGKIVKKQSTAFICSSELASSIVEDKVATTILTDLYDRNYNVENWQSLLKMETFDLKTPTVTMLTATNEAHSSDFFVRKDIVGGYFARTFIVHESKRNRINSLLVEPDNPPDYPRLADYLKKVALLKGQFQPLGSKQENEIYKHPFIETETGRTLYYTDTGLLFEQWYRNFAEVRDKINDKTGTLNRFDDSVLKVAMLISLSKKLELKIDAESMQEAINLCEKFVGNIRRVTLGKTGEADAPSSTRITTLISELMERDNHCISRQKLLEKYWIQGNSKEWDESIQTAAEAGLLTIEPAGQHLMIKMTEISAEQMKAFFQGKMRQ